MGGVARRATVTKGARASEEHLLVLDAGNSLVPIENGAGLRATAAGRVRACGGARVAVSLDPVAS